MKLKLKYLFSISVHIFLCLLILKFFKFNRFIRGFLGDLIFMALIFYIFKLFLNLKNKTLLFTTLIFAYTVEFLQYLKLINILGLENNYYAKIIFGATFDIYDLLAYTLGIIYTYYFNKLFIERK
ncbi:MAG: DUF2809 domain-containing protein [Fusobacteriaceae bacterium]|nr:DUF2809 domain-containing protein [Fusobacteriaceae bacterium]